MTTTDTTTTIGLTKSLPAEELALELLVHSTTLGDQTFHAGELASAPRSVLGGHVLPTLAPLEGFQITLVRPPAGISLEYMAHLPSGDTAWTPAGQFCGTRGVAIEGFAIRLTGPKSAAYSVQYLASIDRVATGAVVDGAFIGTRGQHLAVNGIQLRIRLRAAWLADTGPMDANYAWQSWSGSQHATVAEHYHPTTLQQVIAIVQRALTNSARLRAVGSSWAYSDVGLAPNCLVETHGLAGFLAGPFAGRLLAPLPAQAGQELLMHVEAGITVHALNLMLDARELALVTAGASSGQTICGALSTGTHGGDFNLPPVADMVRAIQLVGPDGTVYWIEKGAHTGAVSDVASVQAIAPYIDAAHIIYDDDCFNSVLVSMGSMGVIYSLVIATRLRYRLQETRYTTTWFDVRTMMANGSLFSDAPWVLADAANAPKGVGVPGQNGLGPPRYVEVAMTPNSVLFDHGNRTCALTLRCETTATPPIDGAAPASTPDFMTALQSIDDYRPFLEAVAALIGSAIPVTGGILGFLGSLAPLLEVVLPGASLVLGTGVVVGSSALALGFPQSSALATALLARARLDPPMNIQETMTFVFNTAAQLRLSSVLPAFNKLILTSMRAPGSQSGPSFAIMDTSVDGNGVQSNDKKNHFVTDSVELFFDASTPSTLVPIIDELLDTVIQPAGEFGGYVSLRLTGPTTAHLGMQQRWSRNCAIEVTLIQGLQGNIDLLQSLERFTLDNGGRLHWGQLNSEMNAGDVHRLYPKIKSWKFVRAKLTHNFTVKTFDNTFTGRSGLNGPPLAPTASIVVVGQGIVSHFNQFTNETTGVGTFRIAAVDLGPLAKVTWNGSVAGSTFDGTVKLNFASVQPGVAQPITVEVTDIYGETVKATASVPVVPGAKIGFGPPTR